MTANTDAQVLRVARAKLAGGGWCKGFAHTGGADEKSCVLGAIWEAKSILRSASSVDHLVDDIARANFGHLDEKLRPAAAYNDHPDTQLEDVLALFDKALAELGAL
jgi:hypothetical protein